MSHAPAETPTPRWAPVLRKDGHELVILGHAGQVTAVSKDATFITVPLPNGPFDTTYESPRIAGEVAKNRTTDLAAEGFEVITDAAIEVFPDNVIEEPHVVGTVGGFQVAIVGGETIDRMVERDQQKSTTDQSQPPSPEALAKLTVENIPGVTATAGGALQTPTVENVVTGAGATGAETPTA